MTWPEVAAQASASLLVVPIGSTEQHGPHLPLSTDTVVAVALADRLAAACGHVLVAPPLAYGSSGEHGAFPGTLSIGQEALEDLLVELVRSADAFVGVVIVSAHGGNASPVGRAMATLTTEGRRVLGWNPSVRAAPGADAHAGRTETSMLLALSPSSVRLGAAEAGNLRPLEELAPALVAHGVAAVSPNGVLGDPAGATANEGERVLQALASDLVATVRSWLARAAG